MCRQGGRGGWGKSESNAPVLGTVLIQGDDLQNFLEVPDAVARRPNVEERRGMVAPENGQLFQTKKGGKMGCGLSERRLEKATWGGK